MGEPDDREGQYSIAGAKTPSADSTGNLKLTLLAEEFSVAREAVETGRLHVSKQTHTREANVDEDLIHEDAIVETVPMGHRIFAMPATRVEGATTIIPIVEEVVYTEKRLILKEEIRVTRRRATEHFHNTVTLRHQEAVVTRTQGATERADTVSGNSIKDTED